MKFPHGRLIQFAREPVLGQVKSRLAVDVGERAALQLHCKLVSHTYSRLYESRLAPVELWVGGDDAHPFFTELRLGHDTKAHRQRGAELGERMHFAIQAALQQCQYAVLVGSDCPVINGAYLEAAFTMLASGTEVVVGPAQDGGYVLIGMRRAYPQLFTSMDWGSDTVLERTRERLGEIACRWQALPELWDVDCKADLERLATLEMFNAPDYLVSSRRASRCRK